MNEEMKAPDLLRAAARLVDRAVLQLDMAPLPDCRECGRHRTSNVLHARIYEQLSDLPEKLKLAADKLDGRDIAPPVQRQQVLHAHQARRPPIGRR